MNEIFKMEDTAKNLNEQKPGFVKLSKKQYQKRFIKGRTKEQIEKTYQKAWEAKNFEIENYWKRANYFWAFQVASFAGYFGVIGSDAYEASPQILYALICIGFVTAQAWLLTNKGSKTWQRHWEQHVDMLEDQITGPLYKVITSPKTFSVSKINELVSQFFRLIWIFLSFKYLFENITFVNNATTKVDWLVIACSGSVAYFTWQMYWGHGRGRFGRRQVTFYERKFDVN